MTGFTKVFGSLLDSTVWQESKETRLVWVTMMVMADRDGMVDASIPGLADRAKVTVGEVEAALKKFTSPDPYSRTQENGGRRIEVIEGGWRLLNHGKYRDKLSAEDVREKAAKRQAEFRKRKKLGIHVAKCTGARRAIKEGLEEATL